MTCQEKFLNESSLKLADVIPLPKTKGKLVGKQFRSVSLLISKLLQKVMYEPILLYMEIYHIYLGPEKDIILNSV